MKLVYLGLFVALVAASLSTYEKVDAISLIRRIINKSLLDKLTTTKSTTTKKLTPQVIRRTTTTTPTPVNRLLSNVNTFTSCLARANSGVNKTENDTFVWELLPVQLRVALLAQRRVQDIWSLEKAASEGEADLTWLSLPESVRELLVEQFDNNYIIYTNNNNQYYIGRNNTIGRSKLIDFYSSRCDMEAERIRAMLSRIQFDTKVDLVKARRCLSGISYGSRVPTAKYWIPLGNYLMKPFRNLISELTATNPNRTEAQVSLHRPLSVLANSADSCFKFPFFRFF